MLSGIIRHLPAALIAVACLGATTALPSLTAAADPSQDQKFFDLLGQKDIPPVDNDDSLIITAKKVCGKLDDGMPAGDLVELLRNNGFNDNPLMRLAPQARITATIDRFINASVEAYCPNDRGKIASISAYHASRPGDTRYLATANTAPSTVRQVVVLASSVGTLPDGEIAPTKPVPVPAAPPPVPQQTQPAPDAPAPVPRRVQPAPKQEPPPPEAPPQEAPPQEAPPAEAPAPAAPAPAAPAPPAPEPAPPTPEQPAPPPGHVRLAP